MRLRSTGPSEYPISDFQGLNRKDAAQRVRDNQFYNIQNFYHSSKGVFQKRFGTTVEASTAIFVGASRITAIHRHHTPYNEKFTLYFCEPNSQQVPASQADLTLTDDPTAGDLFGGAAVSTLRVCYSFYGFGVEQGYNTANRTGYLTGLQNAWTQTGHQSITLSSNTRSLLVTAPPFPSGIKGCNIFVARGNTTQMTYMGTITTSAGSLLVKRYIGPNAAYNDAFGTITASAISDSTGLLKPGTYYVSLAWVSDSGILETQAKDDTVATRLSTSTAVTVGLESNAITVTHSLATSTDGGKACYVFIGTQKSTDQPMLCVGIINSTDTLTIRSLPDNWNAQSIPNSKSQAVPAVFMAAPVASATIQERYGFIIKKDENGTLSEIFPSRSLVAKSTIVDDPDVPVNTDNEYSVYIKTANDNKYNALTSTYDQPYNYGCTVYDPQIAYLSGMSYVANGAEMPWTTDAKTLGRLVRDTGTILPPYARFITAYQNSLVVAGARAKNQVYFSNALQPHNWAASGTGTALNFIGIGDLVGDDLTALGVFTLATDGVNNPRSYILGFKKHGIWMKDALTSGSSLDQLSGRTGCVAYRSITSTNLGLTFLGSDGEWYLVRGAQEPIRIGTSVQPLFAHLVNNDTLMQKVTAVFHDNHLKVSYPSSSSSTYNDAQLWADLRTGPGEPITWVGPHTGINIGPQIVLVGESDDMSRIGARSDVAQVVKLDNTASMTDLGSVIESMVESKTFRFRSEAHMKRVLGAVLDAYWDSSFAHSVLLEGFADADYQQVNKTLSQGTAHWDSSSYDSGSYSDAMYSSIACMFSGTNLVGRTFKFKITHSSQAQFILAAIVLLIKPERRMVT